MLNKVTLIGNLGADPDVRYLPSGGAVTNISLATTRRWKDRDTGERRDATEWHRVVFFNRLAEIAGEYLKKGSQVYIEGRLQTRKWTDKEGIDRYSTEIVASEMQMLGSRTGGTADFGQEKAQEQYNAYEPSAPTQIQNMPHPPATAPVTHQPPQTAPDPAPTTPAELENFDDDIPF